MTPAALCVLDTKNQHSALTVQRCLSAHSEVLSLTTKAILQDLCPATTGKMWIHHIISPIYWIKIGQFGFDLTWVSAPLSSDDCFVFLNVVFSLLLLFSVSTTSHSKPTTSPTLFQTAEHKPKKLHLPGQFFLKTDLALLLLNALAQLSTCSVHPQASLDLDTKPWAVSREQLINE